MTDRKICMEDGTPLSEELIHIEKPEFELVQREQEIRDVEFKTEAVSYGKDVFRRFLRSKTTVVAACITLFIILMGIVGPYISPYNYLEQNVELKNMPPRIQGLEKLGIFDGSEVIEVKKDNLSEYEDCIIKNLGTVTDKSAFGTVEMERIKINMYKYKGADDVYYWFGSDNLGRDLFSRLWQGTRVSLILAFAVVAINLTVGLIVGAICGYYGGWVDLIIQRLMDVIWNIPSLPLTILLIMLFGSGILPLMLVFCLTGWMGMANGVRMQFYRYKNKEYVLAARTMGASDVRIMLAMYFRMR